MRKENSDTIQAFPIEANTFGGVATDLDVTSFNIVHAVADGTITFAFPSGAIAVPVIAGNDLAIGVGCLTITSDASVLVS